MTSITLRMAPSDEPGRVQRQCGACSLCCKLIPVPPMQKVAGEKCAHQRSTGCNIYARRPMECRVWHCKWIINDDAAELSRPDRSHYVIDMMPDYVTVTNNENGERFDLPCVQIWVDPKHRDAHRDPALRRWLLRRANDGFVALVRYNATEGFALMPPTMTHDGKWHEVDHGMREKEHSFDDVMRAVAGVPGAKGRT